MKHTRKHGKHGKRHTKKRSMRFEQIKKLVASFRGQRGGGNFTDGACDLTPLTSEDFDTIDALPAITETDLTGLTNDSCHVEGGNNRVCTKKCSKDATVEVIYRESLRSLADWEILKNIEEIKTQIIFAENSLAPKVYMYGIINEHESLLSLPPTLSAPALGLMNPADMPPPPPPNSNTLSLPSEKTPSSPLGLLMPPIIPPSEDSSLSKAPYTKKFYSIMEKFNDFFDFFADYTHSINSAETIHHDIFTDLINKTMTIYDGVANEGYIFTDLKPDNLVYSYMPIGDTYSSDHIQVRMIDFDPLFVINTGKAPHNGLNSAIMKYLFCRYIVSVLSPEWFDVCLRKNPEGFGIIQYHATLRNPDGGIMDRKKPLVRMLNHIYTENDGDIQRIYNRYNPKFVLKYSFLSSKKKRGISSANRSSNMDRVLHKTDSIEQYL